ncbi:MAG: type II toxin-antitoxin system VapC family toxin [Verrucomicrobia bacterium]|nr:type II toxin-antitoxin system VapC family toxin [Verrucomicrobiota bacterium]MBV8483450.1 type II toxin-antitoxin system VapC family toxin [Verrucomicrobiota bacterium]
MNYLVDTNAASELMKIAPEESVLNWALSNQETCFLSVITIGEIERGIELLATGRKKQRLRIAFAELIEAMEDRTLAFDRAVAHQWAILTGAWQRKGKTLPVLDSMIEATAVRWNLTIVTRNTTDFVEAQTLDPWKS